jgi:hypothetical protein
VASEAPTRFMLSVTQTAGAAWALTAPDRNREKEPNIVKIRKRKKDDLKIGIKLNSLGLVDRLVCFGFELGGKVFRAPRPSYWEYYVRRNSPRQVCQAE